MHLTQPAESELSLALLTRARECLQWGNGLDFLSSPESLSSFASHRKWETDGHFVDRMGRENTKHSTQKKTGHTAHRRVSAVYSGDPGAGGSGGLLPLSRTTRVYVPHIPRPGKDQNSEFGVYGMPITFPPLS